MITVEGPFELHKAEDRQLLVDGDAEFFMYFSRPGHTAFMRAVVKLKGDATVRAELVDTAKWVQAAMNEKWERDQEISRLMPANRREITLEMVKAILPAVIQEETINSLVTAPDKEIDMYAETVIKLANRLTHKLLK